MTLEFWDILYVSVMINHDMQEPIRGYLSVLLGFAQSQKENRAAKQRMSQWGNVTLLYLLQATQ